MIVKTYVDLGYWDRDYVAEIYPRDIDVTITDSKSISINMGDTIQSNVPIRTNTKQIKVT